MRVAIVGTGFGLDFHFPAYCALPGVEVVAFSDSGTGKEKSRLPYGLYCTSSLKELVNLDVDVISVATPPSSQTKIVLAALEHGKHVFCEKPFGLNYSEALTIVEAAQFVPTIKIGSNFQFRFEPGIAVLKEQLKAGAIGELRSIDISWITAGRANPQSLWSWRNDSLRGGGVVRAFFSHIADLLCWLIDSQADSIFGYTRIIIPERADELGNMHKVTAEDYLVAMLKMPNNLMVTCRVTNCQFGGNGMRIEVNGDEGVLTYNHVPPFSIVDQSLVLNTPKYYGQLPINVEKLSMEGDSRSFAVNRSVANFVAWVNGNITAQVPTAMDGLRAHRIMNALETSLMLGQRIEIDAKLNLVND